MIYLIGGVSRSGKSTTAIKVWKLTKHLLLNLEKNGSDFLVEGILLWPTLLSEIDNIYLSNLVFLVMRKLMPI